MEMALASLPAEAVQTVDGRPVTTSLAVAEVFEKRHDNVIKAVRNLDVPSEWRVLNFEETSQVVAQPNGGTREVPAYQMTRDGFTLLAMGFTGKRAMSFKLAYIERFNEMERQLADQNRYLDCFDAGRLETALMVARRECQAMRNTLKDKMPIQAKTYSVPSEKEGIEWSIADMAAASSFSILPKISALLREMAQDGHDVGGAEQEASLASYALHQCAVWLCRVGSLPAPPSAIGNRRGSHGLRVPYLTMAGNKVERLPM